MDADPPFGDWRESFFLLQGLYQSPCHIRLVTLFSRIPSTTESKDLFVMSLKIVLYWLTLYVLIYSHYFSRKIMPASFVIH